MPKDFIPVARPLLGQEEVSAAGRAILSGWVTQGPEVAAFEREFAAYVGAPHACAVSSCTTALHLALLAVGVRPGDEVITVSHSYIATANSIRYGAARPVFVDIDPATFNIDPRKIGPAISDRTRAILCVHQMGMPCDMRTILDLARQRGLPVVEDAACAIGSELLWQSQWDKIGKPHGNIACFSFHPRKLLTTGDGGMLTTADAEIDRKFRLWRQHGMSMPDTVRHSSREVVFESYPELGFNYRLTDIQAADRTRAAEAASGGNLAAAADGHPLLSTAGRHSWTCSSRGARLGSRELAKLLRASAERHRSASRSCRRCSTRASRHAEESCARTWNPLTVIPQHGAARKLNVNP